MKTLTTAAFSLCLAFGAVAAHAADDMSKDGMQKSGMSKDAMGKDGMKKDGMARMRCPRTDVEGWHVQGRHGQGRNVEGRMSKDGCREGWHVQRRHVQDGMSKDGMSASSGARRAPSSTWSGTGPDAPRPGAGRSRDTSKEQAMTLGRRRFLGTGAAAALAAALAPHWAAARAAGAASFPMRSATRNGANGSAARNMRCCGGATERPYSSPLNNEHRKGLYTCAGCAHKLFSSDRSSTAAPAGPASGSPAGRRARPRTAPSAWSARRCIAPTVAAIWDTCSTTAAPDRPALA